MSNFYNITLLKTYMLTKLSLIPQIKKDVTQIFVLKDLIELLDLKRVSYTLDETVSLALNDAQLEKIIAHINDKHSLDFSLTIIKEKTLVQKYPVKTYPFMTTDDIKLAREDAEKNPHAQNRIRAEQIIKLEKENRLNIFSTIDSDYKNKKIISFDFEFNPTVMNKFKFEDTFEVGISIQENGKINSYHYIVNENSELKNGNKKDLQKSFNYGISEQVSFKDLQIIVQNHINDKDIIVVHEHSNDLRILDKNNISYDIDKVKDTQIIYSKYFRKDGETQHKTLKKLLADHNIISKNLHNAGNDSRFTLMLFNSMSKEMLSQKRKSSLKNH